MKRAVRKRVYMKGGSWILIFFFVFYYRQGANTTTKSATTPRLTHRQQMRSASKISLTIKEVGGGKKLEQNMSKLSFKANTSMNLKAPHAKPQTARSAGVSKRSGKRSNK